MNELVKSIVVSVEFLILGGLAAFFLVAVFLTPIRTHWKAATKFVLGDGSEANVTI